MPSSHIFPQIYEAKFAIVFAAITNFLGNIKYGKGFALKTSKYANDNIMNAFANKLGVYTNLWLWCAWSSTTSRWFNFGYMTYPLQVLHIN